MRGGRRADRTPVRHTLSWLSYAALAGLAFAAVVALGTVGRAQPLFPDWIIFPLLFFTLAISGGATWRAHRSDPDTTHPFAGLQPPLRRALIVVIACAAIVAGLSFIQLLHGGPERHGDTYFRRNHTEVTQISRAEYLHLDRAEERLFSMGALMFLAVTFGYSVSGAGESRSRTDTGTAAQRG